MKQSLKDSIFIIICVGGLLIPSAIFKQWWLFSVFLVFFVIFGIIEFISTKVTGKTVSQHFWALKKKNSTAAWVIAGCMLLSWLSLIWHFMDK